ncbi:MAG: sigma-70 family RNA polymerase sigma factor [Cumulibacter sp.]
MTSTITIDAETYRAELIGFCYCYFGSYAEAEDAVQETMVRAWQNAEGFENRSSLRTWLYKIATNVCLDMRRAPQRRSLPMDLSAAGDIPVDGSALTTRGEDVWIGPISDAAWSSPDDPASAIEMRESVRLAFVAALQVLPARQRVILILRDVLAWSAQECADLLEVSVSAVNSALQRGRKAMALSKSPQSSDTDDQALLTNYVRAFEAYDVERLVALLRDDAQFSMPPYNLWFCGAANIERWWRGPGQICRNSRTIIVGANGQPAVAVYHDLGDGRWEPFAIHVLDLEGGRISAITHFMGPRVFAEFGLPEEITE